jgi:ATP-dependent DNA helicase PIF1
MNLELNSDQKAALPILRGSSNIFLTGAAGSGKSFLLRAFLKDHQMPVLASTGAASILVGGRTFHSFFGLGIMEGGSTKTIERALGNKRLVKRLKKSEGVIIDEISMISGPMLSAAETITRKARGNTSPWGGMRIIAVGDFAQLPPVNPYSSVRDWAFLDEVWARSEFVPVVLRKPMRATDPEFLEILNDVRIGSITARAKSFLDKRTDPVPLGEFTRLFSKRENVERYNIARLAEIKEPLHSFQTSYIGKERDIETFKKLSPLGDIIHLKKSALIMLRQNDPEGRWVNGTTGLIEKISEDALSVRVLSGRNAGDIFQVVMAEFTLLNAEGAPVVTAKNFPVSLAWAMTIHKAQGTSLDRMQVDLRGLWEPGQAYVALSRAKNSNELYVEGWSPQAIFADPAVKRFHDALMSAQL